MDPTTKLTWIVITCLESERNIGTAVLPLLFKMISESHLNKSMTLCCYGLMGFLQRFDEWNANEFVYSQKPLSQVVQNPNKRSLIATGPATPRLTCSEVPCSQLALGAKSHLEPLSRHMPKIVDRKGGGDDQTNTLSPKRAALIPLVDTLGCFT